MVKRGNDRYSAHPNVARGVNLELAFRRNSKRNVWLLVFGVIALMFVVAAVVVIVYFSTDSKIENFSDGVTVTMTTNKGVILVVDSESYRLWIDSYDDVFVDFVVDAHEFRLEAAGYKKIDLDKDGFYDVRMEFDYVANGIFSVELTEIREKI